MRKNRLIQAFAIFVFILLGLSQWSYLFFTNQPLWLKPWREYLIFAIPLAYCIVQRKIFRNDLLIVIPSAILILFNSLSIAIYANVNATQFAAASLSYIAAPFFFVVARNVDIDKLVTFLAASKWLILIGGFGLTFDFLTDYSISNRVHFGERISLQNTSVARTYFLFTSVTNAASILGLLLLFNALFQPIFNLVQDKFNYTINLTLVSAAVLGILFTFSRVGFVLIGFFLAFFITNTDKKSLLALSLVAFFISALSFASRDSDATEFFIERLKYLNISNITDSTNDLRVGVWISGIESIKENWLFGNGIGTGSTRSAQYGNINHFESTPLAVINESGIFGFFAFYFFFILIIIKSKRIAFLGVPQSRILFFAIAFLFATTVNPGGTDYLFIILCSSIAGLLTHRDLPAIRNSFKYQSPN